MALRRLIRGVLVFDRVGWLVAAAICAGLLIGVIDYSLRLPSWARVGTLAAGLVAIGWWWMTRVRPAAKFRPSLEELALRVERSAGGEGAGVLASGVGLAGEESARAGAVVERARGALEKVSIARHVNWRRPAVAALVFLSAGAVVTTMLAFSPYSTLLGARRVLTPWTSAEWPKRTGVRDITGVSVHPTGYALPLRAALVKGDKTARVTVKYRVNGGPVREQALSPQGREVVVSPEPSTETVANEPLHGALLETLLEPGVLSPSAEEAVKEGTLEYWFVSSDDRTDATKVRLVPPPAVVGAEVKVTPPAYASAGEPRVLEAGPGTDQRATVPGVLPGSRVELTVRMNKAVRVPSSNASERNAWVNAALGEQAASLASETDTELSTEPTVWRIAWTQRKSVRLAVHPVDVDGVEPAAESVYRVEVREDRPPEAVVVQPSQDIEVLPTAKVSVQTEGRDDVGVSWVAAEFAVASPKTGSASTEVEVSGDRTVLARVEGAKAGERPVAVLSASGEIDLAKLGVGPGQEVWVTAAAADAYLVDGRSHDPARSSPRRVRVISAERMVEQVWNELTGLRRSAVKTVEQQDALTEKTKRGSDGVPRSQAEITDAVTRLNKAVGELSKRMKENGLSDQDLEQVLSQARSLAEQAKEASSQAGESARKAEQAKAEGNKAEQKKAQDEAASSQDKTARSLEQLAETLDRGQDAWSTTRAVQRLIEDQAAVRKQTGELGEKTVGKSQEELSAAEKQKLAELAEQQQQLAKRTDEQLKKLQERAKQMKASDPAGASAMEEAAKKGERSGVSEQMQKAAEQIQKNQQQQAGQQQQQAQSNLEQMLDQLKQNQKSRDATLKRQLASLIETLNRLITMQQTELGSIAAANAAGTADAYKGLDGPMVRLHTQTLAAVSQAREAGKEARRAASLLGEAAEEQQEAVVGLRASPVDGAAVEEHERTSMKKLTEARDEAQRQQDAAAKRESDRQKAEIKQKYQAMLNEQSAVRTEGSDLVGKELDRRSRSRARGLAEREEGLADQAGALLKETKDLQDADLFVLGHERLDALARGAAEGLRTDTVAENVAAKQRGVERVLRQLIDALNEEQGEEEAFREPESGGGGGSQSGQGDAPPMVPPAAEVKLLKSMQQEALTLTREADEAKNAGAADEARTLQRMLAERGAKLLQKMQQQGGGR
ncbi:MAG: hypothetical protein QM783_17135 [Phycisphaerales bacterium]